MNKFITISTCYNVSPYIEFNVMVNKYQSHPNRLHVYVDDQSTDGTYESLLSLTKGLDNFLVIRNENNGSSTKAFMCAIEYLEKNNLIQDEDIIVEVDGDDWLASTFVIQYLDQIYQQKHIWLTYGQYQKWPTGELGGHWNMRLSDFPTQQLRQVPFAYSHLRTFKYWLFNKIDRNDFINPETKDYFSATWDLASGFPLVEMAGNKHIHRCDDVLYILNRAEDLQNEGKTRTKLQKQIETIIRSKQPYNQL